MESFSERMGITPKQRIQIGSINSYLRNRLWNMVKLFCLENKAEVISPLKEEGLFIYSLWDMHFKEPIDTIEDLSFNKVNEEIRKKYFNYKWNEVYNFIEFVANNHPFDDMNELFIRGCNKVLTEEVSGYRFIGKTISQITTETEIKEIEEAINLKDQFEPVTIHLKKALEKLSDRESPDYSNSIKESTCALEAICRIISGDENATLGKALSVIEKEGKINLHTALKESFRKIYGWTSNTGGIRHALMDSQNVDFEDAKFMLVSCSAFINYLKEKAIKAGIF